MVISFSLLLLTSIYSLISIYYTFYFYCTCILAFLNESLRSTYFLPTAAKSRQKGPLEGNALLPIIRQILQVVCTCSGQWQTQSPSMAIALQNSLENRRALSRGKVKSIGFADWEFLVALLLINMDVLLIADSGLSFTSCRNEKRHLRVPFFVSATGKAKATVSN